MKKILSMFLFTIFCCAMPLQGFAVSKSEKSIATKNVIISKYNLEEFLVNGNKYVKSIDKIIEENKDNQDYLENLVEKLNNKRGEFEPFVADENSRKIIFIIDYIVLKAELALINLDETSMIPETLSNQYQSTINEEDAKKIEQRVLSLQGNILRESEDIFEVLQKYTAYEQSGFIEMKLDIDEDSIGTLMSELKITDYISKNNLFDSQFTGDVEGRLEYSIASQDLKFEFSSFVDAIMKDGQFYVMLDDVKSFIETEDSEISALADISKKISTQGKYVRFSDENLGDIELSKEMIENFMNINKYRSLLEKPALEAYKKDGDKYYLLPTQEFCSEAKKVFGGILGNIGDAGCSESQYSDMVKSFLSETDAYMTMNGDISIIHLEEKGGTSKINVSFDNMNITAASMEIINDSPYNPSEMTMAYYRGESINFFITSPEGNGTFNGILDSNNTFESFQMFIDGGEDFNMRMDLLDEELVGSMQASSNGQEIMKADINGALKKDYIDMKMSFEVMDFIRGGENIKANLTMMSDTRDNKGDLDFGLNIEQDNKNIIEFEIISESTIKYGEVEILAPSDFVEAEDVWDIEDINSNIIY